MLSHLGKELRIVAEQNITIKLVVWKAKVQSAVLEDALERTPMTTWKSTTYVKDKLPTDDVEMVACARWNPCVSQGRVREHRVEKLVREI